MKFNRKNILKKIRGFWKDQEGWTFMETLIVIAVVMVLTASVGFMAAGTLEKARATSARSQIESFCVALESYYIDCGNYPTTEQGLSALRTKPELQPVSEKWNGPYIYKAVPKDPWGNEYEYTGSEVEGNPYGIRCFGADGREGGTDKNQDIVSW